MNEIKLTKMEQEDSNNLVLLRENSINLIGLRLKYIREMNNLTLDNLVELSGVSKSTIIRAERDKEDQDTSISTSSLRKLIAAMHFPEKLFFCNPHNQEKWLEQFEVKESSDTLNIYDYCESVLSTIENSTLIYKHQGKNLRLPDQYKDILKDMIRSSIRVLETLPHDLEK